MSYRTTRSPQDEKGSLSLASKPTYIGDKVVINLKNYSWSDGEKVTSKDILFFVNMALAERSQFGYYVHGDFPDNVVSARATGPTQVTLTLNSEYSSDWFTGNQLTEITPLPMAWDKTADSAAPGSGGCTDDESKCGAVFSYLTGKNQAVESYATDPLWQVVDGPWRLKTFNPGGAVEFVPNNRYSGPSKPLISEFKEVPFTSSQALFNAEAGKQVNVGQVPVANLPRRSPKTGDLLPETDPLGGGYVLSVGYVWGWSYGVINYRNPAAGPVFRQLYARQALQETINQPADAAVAWNGYAVPTSGPVPTQPRTDYAAAEQYANDGQGAYLFSTATATRLLTAHGWTNRNGIMTCTNPGSAADQCGAGIAGNAQFSVTVEYNSGSISDSEEMQQWKSDASRAGISLTLHGQPVSTVIADVTQCGSNQATCNWQIGQFGYYGLGPVPTGNAFFTPGSVANFAGVDDGNLTSLIANTVRGDHANAFRDYENYAVQQLPGAVNLPDPYQIYAVSADLRGVAPINPLARINPENWYFVNPVS